MQQQTPMEYQISGMLMVISGFFNGFLSLIWFFMLIWFCVGILWVIPMMIAVGEIAVGVMVLAGMRVPVVQVMSILGLVNSLILFNMWGALFEGIAVVLQFQPKVRGYLEG